MTNKRFRDAKREKYRVARLARLSTEGEAWAVFRERLGDVFFDDNYRSAYADDPAQVTQYEEKRRKGCCGSLDMSVLINGREFLMGCNYGH